MPSLVDASTHPVLPPEQMRRLHEGIIGWYVEHQRDLPWRRPDCSAWGVLVSEVMLQQTPVARVLPVWQAWMERWPAPADLAAEPSGVAVREWGRLGYPRRALRLHAAAIAITRDHGGEVPSTQEQLLDLPGVGSYTAAAVAAFAFGERAVVVDTNIRRVQARVVSGQALPAPSLRRAEVELAQRLLPPEGPPAGTHTIPRPSFPSLSPTSTLRTDTAPPSTTAADTAPQSTTPTSAADSPSALWNVAVMELGALVCTARSPACDLCPVRHLCAWHQAGSPPYTGPARRGQAWAGTDRQCRGALLQVLREADGPVAGSLLRQAWSAPAQRERCLDDLVSEGLVEPLQEDHFRLPGLG